VTPTITGGKGGNDIRIRIPSSFNMDWDTTDTTATIGGTAAGKVSTTVSYEDGGQTLVVTVNTNFVAGDQITVSDLSFASFANTSVADNLELEVNDDNVVSATDDKTITITPPGTPVIFSASNQAFTYQDPATAISTITLFDSATPTITATNDIRIRIPAGFNMTWDIGDTTATIGGTAAAKVSTTVSYEDGGKTLVLNVTGDFISGEDITVSGLSFASFTAASAADNLELEVNNDNVVTATDTKTISITGGPPSLSSTANQVFEVSDPSTVSSTFTVTDDSVAARITASNDVRIRIPAGFNMTWDISITAVVIGGSNGWRPNIGGEYDRGPE